MPLPSELSTTVTQISFYNNIEIKPDTNHREESSSSSSPIKESLPVISEEKEDFRLIKEPKTIPIKKEDPEISDQKTTKEQLNKLKEKEAKKDIQVQNNQEKSETTKKIESKQILKETNDINNQNETEQILADEPKEEAVIQEEIPENKPKVLADTYPPTKEQKRHQLAKERELSQSEMTQAEKNLSLPASNSKRYPNKEIGAIESSEGKEGPLDFTGKLSDKKNIIPPDILVYVPPTYPEKLRKREIEGQVQLKVLISRKGRAVQIQIFHSSGYRSFDQAAVKSVNEWQFSPARVGEKNKESWVIIPVTFCLK